LSNMKQIGLAVVMYAQDYDERMVPSRSELVVVGIRNSPTLLYPYVMNHQVFLCPSQSGIYQHYSPGNTIRFWSNVSPNCRVLPDFVRSNPAFKLTDIKYPAETLVYADVDWTGDKADGNNNSWQVPYAYGPTNFIPARHNGGANLAFADGHAKWHAMQLANLPQVGPTPRTLYPEDVCWYPSGAPKY